MSSIAHHQCARPSRSDRFSPLCSAGDAANVTRRGTLVWGSLLSVSPVDRFIHPSVHYEMFFGLTFAQGVRVMFCVSQSTPVFTSHTHEALSACNGMCPMALFPPTPSLCRPCTLRCTPVPLDLCKGGEALHLGPSFSSKRPPGSGATHPPRRQLLRLLLFVEA